MRALPRAQAVARNQGPERLSDLAMTGWVSRSTTAIDQARRASKLPLPAAVLASTVDQHNARGQWSKPQRDQKDATVRWFPVHLT